MKVIDSKDGKILSRPEGKYDLKIGTISPDGKKIVGLKVDYKKDTQNLALIEIGNPVEKKIMDLDSGDEIHEINWSNDSKKAAVVITRRDYHDEIILMKDGNK